MQHVRAGQGGIRCRYSLLQCGKQPPSLARGKKLSPRVCEEAADEVPALMQTCLAEAILSGRPEEMSQANVVIVAVKQSGMRRAAEQAARILAGTHGPSRLARQVFISQRVFVNWFEKVNSPTKSST